MVGIDGSLTSFNILTGEQYWTSSLDMTMIESIDIKTAKPSSEYFVPTLGGEILAFTSESIWNTKTKVSDFQTMGNIKTVDSTIITGKTERVAIELDLSTGNILSSMKPSLKEEPQESVYTHYPAVQWLSMLAHKYESKDKTSKEAAWKVKHVD